MKKLGLYAGGFVMLLISLYGSLAALVNQGLTIIGAIFVLIIIVGAAGALLYAVKE
jgi:hypothetical protein